MPNDPPEPWQDDAPGDWEPEPSEWDAEYDASGGSETAFCPECGAEIYDAADICPSCFAWIDGDTTRRPPRRQRLRQGGVRVVVWILVGALFIGAGALWALRVLVMTAGI